MCFITEQAGLMERLFSALRMVLAPVRGSLYIVVIVTSTVFAMATGIVGAAYALHKGAHIRTDFFYEKWSVKTKGMVDSLSYVLFFFPSLIMLLAASGSEAIYAYSIHEVSEQTPWRPILWPYKSVVPITCVLLMIQGVSETIKSVYAWRTGIVLEHKEKIEI